MSNPLDLRVTRSLELLGNLVRTVGAISKKEADTVRDLRSRRNAAQRRFQEATEKAETRLSTQAAEVEAFFAADTDRVNSLYQLRRELIQRIHASAIRHLPKRAQDEKRKWMGGLQMRQFKAERKKASDLKDADIAFAEFTAALEEQKAALVAL